VVARAFSAAKRVVADELRRYRFNCRTCVLGVLCALGGERAVGDKPRRYGTRGSSSAICILRVLLRVLRVLRGGILAIPRLETASSGEG